MRSDTVKSAIAVTGAFLLVLAAGTLGWALLRSDGGSAAAWQEAGGGSSGSPAPTGTVGPTAGTTPTTTPSPTGKPTATKKVLPKPTATKKPPAAERPPAQAKPTTDPSCTAPTTSGAKASNSEVKTALVAAAGRQYWAGVQPPSALTVPLPTIIVPADLMKAIAWQESGWQSNIVACDGGVGVMQITPTKGGVEGTDTQVNNRFGENFDINTLSGNASIGAAYVEWLIMYFGLYYFSQNFDLSSEAAVGSGGATLRLLDVVLAAYNVGPGTLEVATNTLSIPSVGAHYAANVVALRTSCPCLKF